MNSETDGENPQQLKFTLITVTYNAATLIESTISSVEGQDYPFVEHLIIDGNSTDRTLAIVHHYMERNSVATTRHEINCLSEPDHGIYDAMNKGLQMATGQYVLFLNAGDRLHASDTLSRLAAIVIQDSPSPAAIFGHTDIVDKQGTFLRHRRLEPSDGMTWKDLRHGMLVCHQALLVSIDIARKTPYDLRYRFSADYDWAIRCLRIAEERELPLIHTPLTISDYLNQGTTTRNHRKSLLERLRIMGNHYGWGTAFTEHLWFIIRLFVKK